MTEPADITPGGPVVLDDLILAGEVIASGPAAGSGVIVAPPTTGAGRLNDLVDVDVTDAPTDQPLVFRRGADGIYRAEPAPLHDHWAGATEVRISAGAPEDDAPPGVFHVDYTTGAIYERTT